MTSFPWCAGIGSLKGGAAWVGIASFCIQSTNAASQHHLSLKWFRRRRLGGGRGEARIVRRVQSSRSFAATGRALPVQSSTPCGERWQLQLLSAPIANRNARLARGISGIMPSDVFVSARCMLVHFDPGVSVLASVRVTAIVFLS